MTTSLDRFAARLKRLERIAVSQSTTPQLAYSAIEDGAIEDYEGDELKMVIGRQFDGAHIAMPVTGPTPPTPAPVVVEPIIGGLKVILRDPLFEDAAAIIPTDFARWEIHVGPTAGFEPDLATTLFATIESPRGGEVMLALPRVEHFVRIVARSASGKGSVASLATAATPRQVEQDDLDPSIDLGGGGTDGNAPTDAPAPSALIGLEQVFITWPRVTNPDPLVYEVAASATSGFDPATNIVGETGGTMAVVSHLADDLPVPTGAPTYVKVRAVDADGAGPWSVEVSATARAGVDQADLAASEQAAQQAAADAQAAQTAAANSASAAAAAQAEADLAQQAADAAAADSSTSASDAAAAASAAQTAQTNATNAANAAAASEAAAVAAEQAAADAASDAEQAATSANGTSRVWYTETAPVTTGRVNKQDDTWFQISAGGDVIGIYRWDTAANAGAGGWVSKPLTHETIASLDAGKITVGEMDASRLTAGSVTAREVGAGVITAEQLAAEAVTAEKIAAHSVSASSLEADMLLSSVIRTGVAGERRVVIEGPAEGRPGGVRLVGTDDRSIVNLPLDGGAAEFNGSINATDGAIIDGGLELRGLENKFMTSSAINLETGIGASATPPGVAVGYDTGQVFGNAVGHLAGDIKGYDATYGMAAIAADFQGWQGRIYLAPAVGSATTTITGYDWPNAQTFNLEQAGINCMPRGGVVFDKSDMTGRKVFVLGQLTDGSSEQSNWGNWYVWSLTLNSDGTITVHGRAAHSNAISNKPIIGHSKNPSDHYITAHWAVSTNRVIVSGHTQTGGSRTQRWSEQTGLLGSDVPAGTRDLTGAYAGNDTDVANGSEALVLSFRQKVIFFGLTYGGGDLSQMIDHTFVTNGDVYGFSPRTGQNMAVQFERFESISGFDMFGVATATRYSSISWLYNTTTTWWAGYTWASHNGSSFVGETPLSAVRQFTMLKRGIVTLSTPSIPDGANAVRFYLDRKSSQPIPSEFNRQTDPTPGTTALTIKPTTKAAGDALLTGAAPPGSTTGFPSATPAKIRSAASDGSGRLIELSGDGAWRLAGLSGDALGNVFNLGVIGEKTASTSPSGYPTGVSVFSTTSASGWPSTNGVVQTIVLSSSRAKQTFVDTSGAEWVRSASSSNFWGGWQKTAIAGSAVPFASRYVTSDVSVAASTTTDIPMTSSNVMQGGMSYSGGAVIVPEAGFYHVVMQANFNRSGSGAAASAYITARLEVNGSDLRAVSRLPNPTDSFSGAILDKVLQLSAGDAVNLAIFSPFALVVRGGDHETYMTVMKTA